MCAPGTVAVRPRIAVVSRDVAPANGGGIATYIHALVNALSTWADVALFTVAENVPRLRRAGAVGGDRVIDDRVAIVAVPDVRFGAHGSYFGHLHRYSAGVRDVLREHYGEHGPDVIEFPDYLGEGSVTVQDRAARAPWLERTTVAVRLHTTIEICGVLNGFLSTDDDRRAMFELERFALQHADVCLAGGGDVAGLYGRYYGARLAPVRTVRHPVPRSVEAGGSVPRVRDHGPLRMIFSGRLERRKGVHDLVRELRGMRTDFRLTLLGKDTDTGPGASSMREVLEASIAGDPRFELRDAVAPEDVQRIVSDHDVAVVPSLWECWPNVGLEALAAGVPLVARPVGGLVEMVGPVGAGGNLGPTRRPGGWLARDASSLALRQLLEGLVGDPGPAREATARRAARERFEALTGRDEVRAAYEELAEGTHPRVRTPRGAPVPRSAPRVTVVVPYFRMHRYVEHAVRSALEQTHRNIHVVVVNDGSFDGEDEVLAELAADPRVSVVTKANAGLGAARNTGIAVSTGPYVVPLDADNVLAPTFVARCLSLLDARPDLEYATSWSRYVREDGTPFANDGSGGWQPMTNDSPELDRRNVAGDAVALIRRRAFDDGLLYDPELTSFEDWFLYLQMRDRSRYGVAIPERLFDYRVRSTSMLQQVDEAAHRRLAAEMQARRREKEVEWCPWNA